MNDESSSPFWERPFPQVYRCKKCGAHEVMWRPEPWAGHACDEGALEEMRKAPQPVEDVSKYLGEWELVAEGTEARALIIRLRLEGKLCPK